MGFGLAYLAFGYVVLQFVGYNNGGGAGLQVAL